MARAERTLSPGSLPQRPAHRTPGPRPLHDSWNDRVRLFVLLLVALWFWWPAGLAFRSDDYLALHWVQDWERVFADFAGPQYGAERVALFHRPLITLSIAIDARLGGNAPFWPLLANVLVHVANGFLAYRLLRRFLPSVAALAATAFWILHPGHTEAVHWMVGRVDTHASFFYLLTLLLYCRHVEGRQHLAFVLVAFVLGCLTKESCLTLPAAIFALELGYGVHFDNRPLLDRSLAALRRQWLHLFVLGLVLALRYAVLGEVIGGYEAAQFRPLAALHLGGIFFDYPEPGVAIAFVGPLLALLLVAFVLRGKAVKALFAILLFVITALPASGSSAEDPRDNARYYYLPHLSLAGATALGGPLPPLLFLGAQLSATGRVHEHSLALAAEVHDVQRVTRERLRAQPEDPVLVPAPRGRFGRVLFAVGTDRLGHPPLHEGHRIVLPQRDLGTGAVIAAPPRGQAEAFYVGPPVLDGGALLQLDANPATAHIGLREVPAETLRVHVAHSLGIAVCELPCAGMAEVSLRDLFYAAPRGTTYPLALALWPATEISLDPRPWLYLEALDAQGRMVAAGKRPVPLPLQDDYGQPPVRPALWILGLVFGLALACRSFRR